MKEEASMKTGDPMFPKSVWPAKQLCPSCYHSLNQKEDENSNIDWDHDEVFKFLVSYYGKTLVTLYKDKDHLGDSGTSMELVEGLAASSAIVVPLGAALAIAVASCAFGALACLWRSRQKNRKYKHQLHSLKTI